MNLNKLFNFNIGLVLSGGGAKGAYQIGIFKALHELQLDRIINVISGTSIGALNGALFLMDNFNLSLKAWEHATYDNFLYLSKNKNSNSFIDAISSLFGKKWDDINFHEFLLKQNISLFSQKGLENIVDRYVDFGQIRKHSKKLFVCAYNANLKQPDYFRLDQLDAETGKKVLLASAAIPFMYKGVEINGYSYFDGGIDNPLYKNNNSDNVPVKPIYEYHCNIIIIVYLDYRDRLDPSFKDSKTTYIEIYPSKPLENIRDIGTVDFTRKSIDEKITLGYRDAMVIIAPLLIKILLGKKFSKLIAEHDKYNRNLLMEQNEK